MLLELNFSQIFTMYESVFWWMLRHYFFKICTYIRTYPAVLHTSSAVLHTVHDCACLLVLHALMACVVNVVQH